MHIDYAIEGYNRYLEISKNRNSADKDFIRFICCEPKILNAAELIAKRENNSIEFISCLCNSIRDTFNSKYKTITQNQKYALSNFLIKNTTPVELIAIAFDMKINDVISKLEIDGFENREIKIGYDNKSAHEDKNFQAWKYGAINPTQDSDNGKWIDKATGEIYDDKFDYIGLRGKELSSLATLAKNGSKLTGLKPLKGTNRQIEWAEKIRFEKVKSMTDSQLSIVKSGNTSTHKAQFWIDLRYIEASKVVYIIDLFYSKGSKK
ncbi:hypothetical protein OO184_19850 [Photorhabdus sp. APURE]|uniref:hypothetical protein n=1 Tax=Photorhabdus aballayi TaxID=2991723 RepID=UPI00223DD133|nr:hypothetical protein [Photorhabdus aballayi]MCW7550124.1 hypothetical protein [Photorhabdus aballayi]